MNMAGHRGAISGANSGILGRERIIAMPGFNRWLVPPAALAIHLCIGMAYGFSVFWLLLSRSLSTATGASVPICAAGATTFLEKTRGTLTALTATHCEWTQFDLGWTFTLFFVLLGSSAAIWGGWLERAGPRKAGVYAALCWCGGLLISAVGVATHQLWMLWIGSGVIGGIGLGLGYISPYRPSSNGFRTGAAGDWTGDHGVWWRSYDRFADRQSAYDPFQDPHLGRSVGNLRRPRGRLFYLHAGRSFRLPSAARGMEPGWLDTPCDDKAHDHVQSCCSG